MFVLCGVLAIGMCGMSTMSHGLLRTLGGFVIMALNLVGMTGQSNVPATDKCSRVGATLPNLAKTVPLDWLCIINLKFTLNFFVLCGT